MARKKQIHEVRTDYLENWIGFYLAYCRPDEANALIKVAIDIGALLDAHEVDQWEMAHSTMAAVEQNPGM